MNTNDKNTINNRMPYENVRIGYTAALPGDEYNRKRYQRRQLYTVRHVSVGAFSGL